MIDRLNQNIKNFRAFRKMTQEELATQIGKTKNVISNWERGDNSPDVDTVVKLCKVLSVTPNQMFGWEPCREYEKYTEEMKMMEEQLKELKQKKDIIQHEIDKISRLLRQEEI